MEKDVLESRISELEIRLSFQDSTIATLDGVVRAQQAEIDRLKSRLDQLFNQQQSADEGVRGEHEKPPHY